MKKIILLPLAVLFCATASIFSQTVTTFTDGTPDDAITLDSNGNIYCSNYVGDTVFKFTPSGEMSAFITGLNTPNGLAFNSNQELYVCDGQGNTIYKYDIDGNQLASYPVTGHPSGIVKSFNDDSMIFTLYTGNLIKKLNTDGTITDVSSAPELSGPVGIVYDENGALFVGNYNNRIIYKVLVNGDLEYLTQLPTEGGSYPNLGFITYGQGKLWGTVMGNDKIYSINPNVVDDYTLFAGSTQGNMDGDINQATFNIPNGIYFDEAEGTMYVTDFGSKNLRIISDIVLSANDFELKKNSIQLYPNPSNGILNVKLDLNGASTYSLNIYNLLGRKLFSTDENVDSSIISKILNIDFLNSGVYFVKVNVDGNEIVKQFVKK